MQDVVAVVHARDGDDSLGEHGGRAFCISCGVENGGDARFCKACGSPLAAPSESREQRSRKASGGPLEQCDCWIRWVGCAKAEAIATWVRGGGSSCLARSISLQRGRAPGLLLHADQEFEVVHVKPVTGEWGLRGDAGEIIVFESDLAPSDLVEVRCDFCGRWSTDAAPTTRVQGALRMCSGGTGPCP
jgi:hypothetical protein